MQEVYHKSPGSAITSETWPLPSVARMMVMVMVVVVVAAMEVARGAYNSSAGPVKNGLASSREKLCECSRPIPRREWRTRVVLAAEPGTRNL